MLNNRNYRSMLIAFGVITIISFCVCVVLYGVHAGLFTAACEIALAAVFALFTRQRFMDINALNAYLDKVLSGDDVPDIRDQEEGELSILKANIYKATTTLKYQRETISKDKKNLAEAMADISHQLKTPLTSIMVMNDLLMSETNEEERKKFLKTQCKQLDKMNWLIQTLLKLSKIDAGTISLKAENLAADALIKEAVEPFEIQMDIRNVKFEAVSKGISVRCDRKWTVEALQNIIKNCLEHMDDEGKLKICQEENNIYKQIIIEDTGCGISKEDIEHIFERFYKGKNAGNDSVGIGLALAKSIITSQKGDIVVSSEEGVGTTFYVRFYKTII